MLIGGIRDKYLNEPRMGVSRATGESLIQHASSARAWRLRAGTPLEIRGWELGLLVLFTHMIGSTYLILGMSECFWPWSVVSTPRPLRSRYYAKAPANPAEWVRHGIVGLTHRAWAPEAWIYAVLTEKEAEKRRERCWSL